MIHLVCGSISLGRGGTTMATDNAVTPEITELQMRLSENPTIKKRERRPNYTLEEKSYLAQLVTTYRDIVEDKRTGSIFYRKKKEAWRIIALKYNAKCTTGPRETDHLKTLYDNMKQQARKHDGEFVMNTITKLRLFKKIDKVKKSCETQAEEDAVKVLQNMREEKLQAQNEHNGFYYQPNTDDPEHVEPLSNPYDSAAAYFRDTVNHEPPPENNLDARCNPPYNGNQQSAVDPIQILDVSLRENQHVDAKSNIVSNNKSESNSRSSQPSTSFVASPESIKLEKSSPKQLKRPLSLEALKKLYFKKKCRNANLEQKRILQEIAHAQEKHYLEMIILRRSLDKE